MHFQRNSYEGSSPGYGSKPHTLRIPSRPVRQETKGIVKSLELITPRKGPIVWQQKDCKTRAEGARCFQNVDRRTWKLSVQVLDQGELSHVR